MNILRYRLLDFIADFANWDNSTQADYLETSRALTQCAHESLGGILGTRPLVVDPFAGGGAIPLEALRVGADAFASDLNPVAVLLNKVVLEYIPKYGQKLADEVRKWGEWIKEEAEKELGEFYPKDADGSTPIAYLWARTIVCEGPGCGAEVPLMRSFWLAKKSNKSVALRVIPNPEEKRVDFEIIENIKAKDVKEGTVKRGSGTCPCCGYTTPVASVRKQFKARRGGADDARLFCVVTTRESEKGRFYRLPTEKDLEAVRKATQELEKRKREHQGELSLVPDEPTPDNTGHRAVGSVFIYGMEEWGHLFTSRQSLALTTLVRLVKDLGEKLADGENQGLAIAVQTVLGLAVSRFSDICNSLCMWENTKTQVRHAFTRQAIPMMWDFAEPNVFAEAAGNYYVTFVQGSRIDERVRVEIQKVFATSQGIQVIHFPEQSSNIPNQALLTLAVMAPDRAHSEENTLQLVEGMIRESGASSRTFKSALLFAIADSDVKLREEARKVLAWEDIRDEEQNLDDTQKKHLSENLKKAQRDLVESVWRAYKYVALLNKDNTVRVVNLGLVTSSSAKSPVELILNRLLQDGDVSERISPRFLVRTWSGAFTEWSTQSVRDAFFASPLFPRLLKPDAVKEAISRGVKDGILAYVGKTSGDRYQPFEFKTDLAATQVEISEDMFILKAEEAEAYLQRITDPPKLSALVISPPRVQLEPGKKQSFTVRGRDQYDQEIAIDDIQWTATGGAISLDGVLTAGTDEGNFTVTATAGTIRAIGEFSVKAPQTVSAKEKAMPYQVADETELPPPQPKGLKWTGEIAPQKWMNFYTRVLSKFASDKAVKLTVKIEVAIEGEVSEQKQEEMKVALQELGLDDRLEGNE